MADKERKQPNSKLRRALHSFLIFFLVLVIVLGVVIVAAYRDGTGFDVLRRYFNYGSTETVGGESIYDYDAAPSNRFAMVGDHLAVLSTASIRVLDSNGGEVWSAPVKMDHPALISGGGRAVGYDVGGTELYVLGEEGLLMKLTADEKEPFISATLNDQGWLAVTAEKKNYKGCVKVYSEDLEDVIFEFNSSSRFVTDAYVSEDTTHLAAVTLGQEEGVFVSNVVVYDMTATADDAEENASGGMTAAPPVADYDIRDGLVAAIGEHEGALTAVTDNCVAFGSVKGGAPVTYSYSEEHLRDYDLHGDDFTVLLLNRYQSGSVGRVVTVAPDGTEIGSLDVNREILDLSAAGRYLAVLYMDSLVIYNREMQVYATLNGTDYAKAVLMRPDGSALLLSSEAATLFLP